MEVKKCILAGWSGADWELLNPLIDAGRMPCLGRLMETGSAGGLSTSGPLIPAVQWSTVATGHTAIRHGVLTATEPDPRSGGVRPAGSASRQTKAIWNLLEEAGFRAHVAGWPASHPADPIGGVFVSDAFCKATAPYGIPWPVQPGAAHPASAEESLLELRVHGGDLGGQDLLTFLPRLREIDQRQDLRVAKLAAVLAETVTIHAAATWILEHQAWDFLAVHYGAIGAARTLSPDGDDLFQSVPGAVCCFLDAMLARLLELAGENVRLVLVSPYGIAPTGLITLSGPGFRRDELVFGVSTLDVVPTILAGFGLPAGEDMPGSAIRAAMRHAEIPERIPTWEGMPAAPREHPLAVAGIRELASLGYGGEVSLGLSDLARQSGKEARLNLAMLHLEQAAPEQAAQLLEELLADFPGEPSIGTHFAYACLLAGRHAECRAECVALEADAATHGAAQLLLGALALEAGDRAGALQRVRQAATGTLQPPLRCLAGHAFLALGRQAEAELAFTEVIARAPGIAAAHHGIARIRVEQNRFEEGAEAALTAIGIRFHSPHTHYLLGVALVGLGKFARAIQAFETGLAQQPGMTAAADWIDVLRKRTEA